MSERWKSVPGYEGLYEVSDHGRVRSRHSWRGTKKRTLSTTPGGRQARYVRVELWRDRKRTKHSVHRLVLEAFMGLPPEDMREGAHLDNDPANNKLENLAWSTRADNVAMIHGVLEGEDVAEREAVRLEALDRLRPSVTDRADGCPF